jgi:Cu+-exporting ATPase
MYVLCSGLNPNFVKINVMKKFAAFLVLIGLMACQNQSNNAIVVERIQEQGEVAKTSTKLSIDGMTCAQGCGGKIQKELEKLPGVVTTQLDFVEERKVNVVTAEFQSDKVSVEKMMEVVNTIADGKYKVLAAKEITTTKK